LLALQLIRYKGKEGEDKWTTNDDSYRIKAFYDHVLPILVSKKWTPSLTGVACKFLQKRYKVFIFPDERHGTSEKSSDTEEGSTRSSDHSTKRHHKKSSKAKEGYASESENDLRRRSRSRSSDSSTKRQPTRVILSNTVEAEDDLPPLKSKDRPRKNPYYEWAKK
jgi:hypothetical protein